MRELEPDEVEAALRREIPEEDNWDIEEDEDFEQGPCAACGHDPACGFAQVNDDWLCHEDDHSCYVSSQLPGMWEWADLIGGSTDV